MVVPAINFRSLDGSPLREFYEFVPSSGGSGAPLLVLVHGISRRALEQVASFAETAERLGVVLLAPLFGKPQYGQYQQVVDRRGNRCDLALLEMVNALTSETGCRGDRFHIFGYSGGAQFAHRFAMLHPARIGSMSVAAAGWYTMPDLTLDFPFGIGTHPLSSGRFQPELFLGVDRHVFVGSADNVPDESLRSTQDLNERQGRSRLERATRWAAAMNEASRQLGAYPESSTFELLKGVGHSFSSSVRRRNLPDRVFSKIASRLSEGS